MLYKLCIWTTNIKYPNLMVIILRTESAADIKTTASSCMTLNEIK